VAEKLSEEKVRKLFQVEIAAHFRFRIAHLERLCAIGDEREFYQSAACAAGFGVEVEQMDSAVERTDAAYTLDWFKRVIPRVQGAGEGDSSGPTVSGTSSGRTRRPAS
jgi:hypothetical protein